MKPSERIKVSRDGDNYILSVSKCSLSDAGEYTCNAKDAGGESFCSVNVTVDGKYVTGTRYLKITFLYLLLDNVFLSLNRIIGFNFFYLCDVLVLILIAQFIYWHAS